MNVETADKLVKLRKEFGLSQEALAEKIGVSRQAVSKWERAESSPDTDNLIALSKLYGISIDELINGNYDGMKTSNKKKSKNYLKHKQDAWAAIGSIIAVIIFFLLGFLFNLWHIGWIVFLIIPIFYYIPIIKNPR